LSLQAPSGGFRGGYGRGASYFPNEEIGWAVKFFLDAFVLKIRSAASRDVEGLPDRISLEDGRAQLVRRVVEVSHPEVLLDVGCGKGRYLRMLRDSGVNAATCYGLDLSPEMLERLPGFVRPIRGGLLDIPLPDAAVDMVLCCEALEHAVAVPQALAQLARVLRPGGTLLILDKNLHTRWKSDIGEWEQWFDAEELARALERHFETVEIARDVPYMSRSGPPDLFVAWIARKSPR
jgi:malonyl-CoA O-methyltransferase